MALNPTKNFWFSNFWFSKIILCICSLFFTHQLYSKEDKSKLLKKSELSTKNTIIRGIPSRITSLDPFSVSSLDAYEALSLVIEPLVRTDPVTKELQPWLAESWIFKKNSVVIHLKEGIQFHSGHLLTANDVKFTYDTYFDSKISDSLWQGMWQGIDKVNVIDQLTVEVFSRKFDYDAFIRFLSSLRILPKAAYHLKNKDWRRLNLIGTGPFILARFEPGKSIDLKTNPSWWKDKALSFDLRIKSVSDWKLAEMMIQKGELDYYDIEGSLASQINSKFLYAIEGPFGDFIGIHLNLKKSIFKDIRVRRALVKLWNRSLLNERVFAGKWKIALDMFNQNLPTYPKGEALAFSTQDAVVELKQAGYQDLNHDSILEKDGNMLKFDLVVKNVEFEKWITLFKEDARKAGVLVNILKVEDQAQIIDMIRHGKFDALADSGSSDVPHSVTWHSKGPYANFGYINKAVDHLLEEITEVSDLKQRNLIYGKAIVHIRADLPVIPGLFSNLKYLLKSKRLVLDSKFPTEAWRWSIAK